MRAIDDRHESLAAFQLLQERVRKDAQTFRDHPIGWQGGSRRYTACWLPKLNIWAVLEPSPPDSKKGPSVEINPPHEGDDRRVAGLFARDEHHRMYIAHTGKVGGGRKGIGPNAFRKFLGDPPWKEIDTRSGRRTAIVLGPIEGPDFLIQLAEFVHKVADFKESVAIGVGR